jgi:fibronectin-binding autotransporter adhesin
MLGKVMRWDVDAANRSELVFVARGVALCAAIFLFYMTATTHATIVGLGDLDPLDPNTWTSSTDGYVGLTSTGTVTVNGGSNLLSRYGYVGYDAGSMGTVTVTGADSKWTARSVLYVGHSGNGTLSIKAGGQVSDDAGYLAFNFGALGTVTVNGSGSLWSNYDLYIGCSGDGILKVEAGGSVQNYFVGFLGYDFGATGTATITGAGSNWTSSDDLHIGFSGNGTLSIKAGGQVRDNANTYLGYYSDSTGTATVSGAGSVWTNDGFLCVGRSGSGMLNIGSDGDSGGLVKTETLRLAEYSSSTGTCNLNKGGTLQTAAIVGGIGIANVNWNDGTIQNYDPHTNLTVSSANNLILQLAATGTHAFNIDAGCTGTIDAVLSEATSGGTLTKQGKGLLTLTGANTYSGKTTVEAGWFKVTGSIVNTSAMDVSAGATLELAKTSGSATVGSLEIDNAGTILISAGSQTVSEIRGTGVTQVNSDATLTAKSIVQNSLLIGATGAGMGGEMMSQVPEPGSMVLSFLGIVGAVLVHTWRQRRK